MQPPGYAPELVGVAYLEVHGGDRSLGMSQMHISRLRERALTYLRTQITKLA